MDPAEEFIANFLEHKRVYDPVKAREYYLRTRELKGRRSASALKTESKKERWAYVKDQVKTERTESMGSAREGNSAQIKALRAKASSRRGDIRERLKQVIALLTEDRKEDLSDIKEDVNAKIAALPPIPKGVSKARRAKLSADRKEEIATIRGEAKEDRAEVSEDTKAAKTTERATATASREKVSADLKVSVNKARENYKKLKEELKANYEAEYQKEYDAIKNS
jgi:DNA polymerase III delta prime subunit